MDQQHWTTTTPHPLDESQLRELYDQAHDDNPEQSEHERLASDIDPAQ